MVEEGTPVGVDQVRIRELAYKESVRRLEFQAEQLSSLHTRAGVLLAGASAATAFFGGAALDRLTGDLPPLFYLAGLAFVFVGVGSALVIWPRALALTDDAEAILREYEDRSISETYRWMAHYNARNSMKNERRLRWVRIVLALTAVLLIVEIALWLWLVLVEV